MMISSLVFILLGMTLTAQGQNDSRDETGSDKLFTDWERMHESKAEALTAFNEAKFGMFIHWGLYSIPAGIWNGERVEEGGVGPTVAEWIMRRKSIPRAEYAKLATKFNPVKFDAKEWASIAADAGMKYMVITAKHHDGFALFDSQVSEFDIVDATPFKRDVIKELHDACANTGVRFGVYYSHTLDWHDGGDYGRKKYATTVSGLRKIAVNDWDPSPLSFNEYMNQKALPQVDELARRFPDLFLIWFDGAGYLPESGSFDFYKTIYNHAPGTLVQSRISAGELPRHLGDYQSSGDNHIPEKEDIDSQYWETCGTMNNSWGYKSYDHDWKQPIEVLSWLIDVVSRGGNYLLNVGPTDEGIIPPDSVRILREVGTWLRVNGEAIYGTRAWTVFREGPTVLTRKGTGHREKQGFKAEFTPQDLWFTKRGKAVYVIALAYPKDGKVTVFSMKELPVSNVRVLGSGQTVSWKHTAEGLSVTLPDNPASSCGYALEVLTEE